MGGLWWIVGGLGGLWVRVGCVGCVGYVGCVGCVIDETSRGADVHYPES